MDRDSRPSEIISTLAQGNFVEYVDQHAHSVALTTDSAMHSTLRMS
jgi:hypothetical protein